MKKPKPNYIVATVEECEAIDMTKIYLITPIKNIRAHTPLRFDTAKNIIETNFKMVNPFN